VWNVPPTAFTNLSTFDAAGADPTNVKSKARKSTLPTSSNASFITLNVFGSLLPATVSCSGHCSAIVSHDASAFAGADGPFAAETAINVRSAMNPEDLTKKTFCLLGQSYSELVSTSSDLQSTEGSRVWAAAVTHNASRPPIARTCRGFRLAIRTDLPVSISDEYSRVTNSPQSGMGANVSNWKAVRRSEPAFLAGDSPCERSSTAKESLVPRTCNSISAHNNLVPPKSESVD